MVSFIGLFVCVWNWHIKTFFDTWLEYSFLYEEKSIKSLSNILNLENTCGYITCVTTPTKFEKKFNSEPSIICG